MLLTQGFIARHADGGTAILGRGGSDTSAAYFGALLGAQRVEIWTDVPGMFSANPREVPDARLLTRLDYAEAQEIATTGAKVLHPRSIKPCRDAGVPMAILDTERPELPGTSIDGSAATVPGVKAISRRNGIVLVSMESIGMWQQVGFLADVFERFKRHGLSVDLIGSSETNVTVSLDPSENLVSTDVLAALSADLAEICRVKVIAPCAAITLVGRGMRSLLHKLSDVWATFGRERVHLISQSSNDLNLTFVIDEADADGLLPQLHAELIDSGAMPVARRQRVRPELARDRSTASRSAQPPWWQGERERLLQCAAGGTPRYVYHLPTVRARARSLLDIAAIDRRFFAIKANPHPAILRALVDGRLRPGMRVAGRTRARVRDAAASSTRSACCSRPSFAPRAEYDAAFALRRDRDRSTTSRRCSAGRRCSAAATLWLRLDLGRGDGHHAKVRTGGAASKFGLPLAQRRCVRRRGAQRSDVRDHRPARAPGQRHRHHRALARGAAPSSPASPTASARVDTIDIGGGLPIPYKPDDESLRPRCLGRGPGRDQGRVSALSRWRSSRAATSSPKCGVLLAHVTQVVEKEGIRRVGLDAGMNALDAPGAVRGLPRHPQPDAARRAGRHAVRRGRPDLRIRRRVRQAQRMLPAATREGDVVLVADAGAYGFAMANPTTCGRCRKRRCSDD